MKKPVLMMLMAVSLIATGCGSDTSSITGNKDKVITFWHCIGHDKTKNLQVIIDKFNDEHSTAKGGDGYSVTAEKLAGDYDSLHDSVKTKLNAGYVPSITMGYPDSFAEYIGTGGASASKILKLDDLISADTTFKTGDFVTEYYNEGTGYQYEGTYSLPLYKSTEVMYYNIDMFQGTTFYKNNKSATYGANNAVLGNPTTWDWDTFVYVGKQIQAELGGSTSDFHAIGYDSDSNLFISQMAQRDIPFTTAEGKGEAHFKFIGSDGNPDARLSSFAQSVYDLAIDNNDNKGTVLVTKGSYGSYASDLFKKKKVMFTIGSTGGSAYNEPNGSFTCGLSSVPSYNNNKKYIMQGPSLCFFDTKDTAKEKAAWEFYSKFVSDASLNAALALENSYDPIKTASYETDNYKEWTSLGVTSEGVDDTSKQLQYRIPNLTKTLKDNYMTSPVFIGSSAARTEIGNIIKYAKEKGGKVNDAIKQAYTNCVLASTDKA